MAFDYVARRRAFASLDSLRGAREWRSAAAAVSVKVNLALKISGGLSIKTFAA
jgi:hypothetical protein